jgi:hypothetical protein
MEIFYLDVVLRRLVEPVEIVKDGYKAICYFKVHSQSSPLEGRRCVTFPDLEEVLSVLV